MSTRGKPQNGSKKTASTAQQPKSSKPSNNLVKTEGHHRGPLADVADHFLPGTAPITERRVEQYVRQTTFNGPIPHPEIFKQYGDVIPDAPERILRVFEEDSKHAREITREALNAQKRDNRRVHWMAWSLIAGGYGMSALFAWMNKDILAGAVLTTTIIGTLTGFLQGQKNKSTKQEDDEE